MKRDKTTMRSIIMEDLIIIHLMKDIIKVIINPNASSKKVPTEVITEVVTTEAEEEEPVEILLKTL